MLEDDEAIPIVAVQSILCPKPHESFTVLDNAINCALGEPVIDGERSGGVDTSEESAGKSERREGQGDAGIY